MWLKSIHGVSLQCWRGETKREKELQREPKLDLSSSRVYVGGWKGKEQVGEGGGGVSAGRAAVKWH